MLAVAFAAYSENKLKGARTSASFLGCIGISRWTGSPTSWRRLIPRSRPNSRSQRCSGTTRCRLSRRPGAHRPRPMPKQPASCLPWAPQGQSASPPRTRPCQPRALRRRGCPRRSHSRRLRIQRVRFPVVETSSARLSKIRENNPPVSLDHRGRSDDRVRGRRASVTSTAGPILLTA